VKLLAFSDIHLDAVTAGKPRRKEVLSFLQHVWQLVEKHAVDLVIFAGDAHDPGSLTDSMYAADLIRRFSIFPLAQSKPTFVAVAGNHDVVDTSETFIDNPVTTLTPFRVACETMLPEHRALIHVFERPNTREVRKGVAVLGLPYVSRAHAKHFPTWEAHAFNVARGYVKEGHKLVVVGHRVIPGAKMTSESVEMARGQDQLFPFDEVAALNPAIVINGHYHAHQTVRQTGFDIHIPGSPVRFTFGEAQEHSKGVLLAEI
jgi:DNA repair exonuclease SbcCD nuclease subunit